MHPVDERWDGVLQRLEDPATEKLVLSIGSSVLSIVTEVASLHEFVYGSGYLGLAGMAGGLALGIAGNKLAR